MFEAALEHANRFTFPYVGLRRAPDGSVQSTLAAFIVLNADGWALTAGHVVDGLLAARRALEGETHPDSDADGVRRSDSASARARHTELWALPGFNRTHPQLREARVDRLRDLALVRLQPFDAHVVQAFPVLRDTTRDEIKPGLSVCRLGYPFYQVDAAYDSEADEFRIAPRAFPVPRFALDGIVSRFHQRSAEDGRTATFIETSTPGLRGQSGGPLIDADARVCGVQSHTVHLDLGFDAGYEREGERVVERQFLNVGAAVHASEVVAFLDEQGLGGIVSVR